MFLVSRSFLCFSFLQFVRSLMLVPFLVWLRCLRFIRLLLFPFLVRSALPSSPFTFCVWLLSQVYRLPRDFFKLEDSRRSGFAIGFWSSLGLVGFVGWPFDCLGWLNWAG